MNSHSIVPPGVVLSLFALDEEEAYRNGVVLYEIRMKRGPKHWLAILKGVQRGKYVVAFVGGEGLHRALFNVGLASENDEIHWQTDKFPPPRIPVKLNRF